jgi:hypothetical protein
VAKQDLLKVDNRDNRAELKVRSSAKFRRTRPDLSPLHCISHNVFRVDLIAIKNHVLIVLLLSATTNSVLRENRVKRSARCGCIVGRSSLIIV